MQAFLILDFYRIFYDPVLNILLKVYLHGNIFFLLQNAEINELSF